MKIISTLTAFFLFTGLSKAQIVTYDIPFSQTIGLQQTTGDICSAPWTTEEAFQATQGNSWGFTWTSTNAGTPSSVDITLGFTVTDGGGTFPTTLNGSASFSVTDGTAKNCENSTLMTWSVDPTNYVSAGLNTFMVNFATATNVSQVDNLPFAGDPFFRVTVDYTPCAALDTTVSQNQNTLTSNATSATYQWFNCETDSIISGETGVSYTPATTGEYGVIITDIATGCSDTSVCTAVTIVGIDELKEGQLNVYPNPAHKELTLTLIGFEGATLFKVYNMQGQLIYQFNQTIGGTHPLTVNISDLPKGHYQMTAMSNKKTASVRFVKD